MTKKTLICLLVTFFLATVSRAAAQQPAGKIPRIGFVANSSVSEPRNVLRIETLRQGLSGLGYIEGKNINFEFRYAEGKSERLAEFAAELVRLKVDILFAMDSASSQVVKKATTTIPVIITTGSDPVQGRLVASLAHPGGNITGFTTDSPRLIEKRLGLLTEVLPKVNRFAFLMPEDIGGGGIRANFDEANATAKILGVKFQAFTVKAPNPDIDGVFRAMVKERIGGLVTEGPPIINFHRKKILQLAEQHRIPAIHTEQAWANEGGLMSYGANIVEPYRRAAVFIDKILKGTKPAEIPVEQPMRFEFVINLKAAKQINFTVPPEILARANRIIR